MMLCNEYGNVVMANLRTETEIGSRIRDQRVGRGLPRR